MVNGLGTKNSKNNYKKNVHCGLSWLKLVDCWSNLLCWKSFIGRLMQWFLLWFGVVSLGKGVGYLLGGWSCSVVLSKKVLCVLRPGLKPFRPLLIVFSHPT